MSMGKWWYGPLPYEHNLYRLRFIRACRENGWTYEKIGRVLGVCGSRVMQLSKRGVETQPNPDRLQQIDVAVLVRHASTIRSLW